MLSSGRKGRHTTAPADVGVIGPDTVAPVTSASVPVAGSYTAYEPR